jgi:hypothetical protein
MLHSISQACLQMSATKLHKLMPINHNHLLLISLQCSLLTFNLQRKPIKLNQLKSSLPKF